VGRAVISLRDVSRAYGAGRQRKQVLDKLSLTVRPRTSVAILGAAKSGKSTLARLIARQDTPDSGTIYRGMSVSWPVGMPSPMPAIMTVRDYIRLIAALYGADPDLLVENICRLTELRPHMNTLGSHLENIFRNQLAFAITIVLDFDCYVMDQNIIFGPGNFRHVSEKVLERLRGKKTFIMITEQAHVIPKLCDEAYILADGRLIPFETVDDAIQSFKAR